VPKQGILNYGVASQKLPSVIENTDPLPNKSTALGSALWCG